MLQDDDTYKYYAQVSIHRLESVYGRIPHKFGLGSTAATLIKRIEENRLNIDQCTSNSSYANQESEIDALIMFDRSVDLVSPFCRGQNFEAFMDENIGIECTKVSIDNTVLYPDPDVREELKVKENDKTELELTSEEPMYDHIKDKHFDYAGPYLNSQLKEIQGIIKRQENNRETTEEIKAFIDRVKKLNPTKAKQIATQFINVMAKFVKEQRESLDFQRLYQLEGVCINADPADLKDVVPVLESQMTKGSDKLSILRYMCLYSTTQGGLSKVEFDYLRRSFIMNYGYQEMATLMNL